MSIDFEFEICITLVRLDGVLRTFPMRTRNIKSTLEIFTFSFLLPTPRTLYPCSYSYEPYRQLWIFSSSCFMNELNNFDNMQVYNLCHWNFLSISNVLCFYLESQGSFLGNIGSWVKCLHWKLVFLLHYLLLGPISFLFSPLLNPECSLWPENKL